MMGGVLGDAAYIFLNRKNRDDIGAARGKLSMATGSFIMR